MHGEQGDPDPAPATDRSRRVTRGEPLVTDSVWSPSDSRSPRAPRRWRQPSLEVSSDPAIGATAAPAPATSAADPTPEISESAEISAVTKVTKATKVTKVSEATEAAEVAEVAEAPAVAAGSTPGPGPRRPLAALGAPRPEAPETPGAPTLATLVDTVFTSWGAGGRPGTPPTSPAPWALLAFARREIDPAASVAKVAAKPVTTGQTTAAEQAPIGLAPGVVVSPGLYEHTEVTGPPSFSDRITVAVLGVLHQISKVVGFDISYVLSGLMASANPPWMARIGVGAEQSQYTFTDAAGAEQSWKVWEIASRHPSGEQVIAVHGGALVYQPNRIQWMDYASMARATGATVVVPIFPMVTPGEGGNAETIVAPMADFIAARVAEHGADNVSIYADSSGGLIATVAMQKIVRDCAGSPECVAAAMPGRAVLLSPGLSGNSLFTDPNAELVSDPVSSIPEPGEGPDWQGDLPDGDPLWDPTAGSVDGLPPTTFYLGTRDILTPSALVFAQRMLDAGREVGVVLGMGQIHDWAQGGIYSNSQAPRYRDDVYRQLGIAGEPDPA
ncbi:alpha/beta hydrolase [Mycolicibacterium palauense]|uniref:alpha/beta hydrolase n=1 Tax=Mycolicibacterium palauense TaxID=2034511 RepID=UPI00159BCAC6|nr:alpha/beta hydrolase [Mycolicibacterium palauense]